MVNDDQQLMSESHSGLVFPESTRQAVRTRIKGVVLHVRNHPG